MAIDPKLVSIKKVTDIPTVPLSELQTGQMFGYTGDGDLKKVATNDLLGFIKSGIKGTATQSNAPTPYTPEDYPNGLFETYVVRTPLTMPNSWGFAVTQAELDANYVFFDVENGVVAKNLSFKNEVNGLVEEGNTHAVSGREVYLNSINPNTYNNYELSQNKVNTLFSKHIKNIWVKDKYNEESKGVDLRINYFSYKTYFAEGISIQVSQFIGSSWVVVSDFNFPVSIWEKDVCLISEGTSLSYYNLIIQLGEEPSSSIPLVSYEDKELILKKSAQITYWMPDVFKLNSGKFVTVGKNQMYDNIQDALNKIKDAPDNQITIIVFPGIYPFFATGDRKRYINIIGINKDECIVRDDSGSYYRSPAQMWFNGTVENLTLYATHNEETAPVSGLKSYALHMDYGSNKAKFKNCYFYSENASAVGIGTYQDDYIEFDNCILVNNVPTSYFPYAYLPNYGALFIHSAVGSTITNQNIVLKNCEVIGANSNYAAYLTSIDSYWDFSPHITAKIINTTFLNKDLVGKLRMEFIIHPSSHGNNNSNLNYVSSATLNS